MAFADLLEKITYNALPTQASDDYLTRQYFQAANQVELSDRLKSSYETDNHGGTDFVFGTLTGYPCCTTNMHQSWPKFVQNLFYATPDRGVATLMYAPSEVKLNVGNATELTIIETTGFPFREEVRFDLNLSQTDRFPFHLRIPSWTQNPEVFINGQKEEFQIKNQVAILDREWKDGDEVVLKLPMKMTSSNWYQGMASIERGPLVYSLKLEGEEKIKDRNDRFRAFTEVFPKSAWNFGLLKEMLTPLESSIEVHEKEWDGTYPWNLENAPIELQTTGILLPDWKLVNGAPELPGSYPITFASSELEPLKKRITLVPYGCTTLRITEFPVVGKN